MMVASFGDSMPERVVDASERGKSEKDKTIHSYS